jgi:NTP pyrophosphatase (non-canonical NTP hydrolase)
MDIYSYIEKCAGVPKDVSRCVDEGKAFSAEFLKDMDYSVPKGYEIKGDLVCPVEKTAEYEWYKSKDLSQRLVAGRPYPFSYLTGEAKELVDAVKNRDWENFKEEIGDTSFGAQMLLSQLTGLNHPVYADLSKAWKREKVWQDMFKEKGGTYHPNHMQGGSNFAKPSKIIKAFASAGITINQQEAERLANKYTGGKMEKESSEKTAVADHPLKSSNIKAVGYDKKEKTLDVAFHSGGEYTYKDVPKSLFDRIKKVKSPGRFFHKHIKKKEYPYAKQEKE